MKIRKTLANERAEKAKKLNNLNCNYKLLVQFFFIPFSYPCLCVLFAKRKHGYIGLIDLMRCLYKNRSIAEEEECNTNDSQNQITNGKEMEKLRCG